MASSLARMAQKALINDLVTSISTQTKDATFACGGSIPVKKNADTGDDDDDGSHSPVQIRFGEQDRGVLVTLPKDDTESEPLKKLLAACTPASFGRGQQEVLDDTYRKASKLDADRFATNFCPYACGIIDIVLQMLLPNVIAPGSEKRSIRAELYKLNIYSAPSGKFKAHVDTPRSDAQFGSLVVCLPVAHQGGELVVRNGSTDVVFDWAAPDANHSGPKLGHATDQAGQGAAALAPPSSSIHWAAFYSDCEHEVLEVTSGHRITLTYNLYVRCGAGNLAGNIRDGLLNPTQLPLYETLKQALDTPGFMPRGRVLGVYLAHSYAHTIPASNFLPSSLKGTDMTLYETARALGLTCYVRPVVKIDYYYAHDDDAPEHLLRSRPGFPAYKNAKWCSGEGYGEDEAMITYEGWKISVDKSKLTWLNSATFTEPSVGHATYGNEPGSGTVYSSAVLFIRIPPQSERLRGSSAAEAPERMFDGIEADTAAYQPKFGPRANDGGEDSEDEDTIVDDSEGEDGGAQDDEGESMSDGE
ncbi:P4Hc domain containing protein [Teratosphaeria destructans]|uniref:P4Hc domain containing protein n=1 Tax=Teratosphaeria destructans TaxID=418781 RepID=A0A9W7W5J6_9PEZI|nr:P4Hc domain containing protein [Teratosphaeria destructans]